MILPNQSTRTEIGYKDEKLTKMSETCRDGESKSISCWTEIICPDLRKLREGGRERERER